MDDNYIKLAIGIVTGLIGAALAGAINAYAANQKIKELKIQHQQQMRIGYLENARKVAEEVYIPIIIAISRLSISYDNLRSETNFANGFVSPLLLETLKQNAKAYLQLQGDLAERGSDAYLTNELDQKLQHFNNFLRRSLEATDMRKLEVFKAEIPIVLGLYSIVTPVRTQVKNRLLHDNRSYSTIREKLMNVFERPFSIGFAGLALSYDYEVVYAPVTSREFEKRIIAEVPLLKALIKEVTLGSFDAAS